MIEDWSGAVDYRKRCDELEAELAAAKADLAKAIANHSADLRPEATLREPDGYAVVMAVPKTQHPKGHWFVGCYHNLDVAESVAKKGDGYRVEPIYFNPQLPQNGSGS